MTVDVANDGIDGLWRVREFAYDVVLLDVMMPDRASDAPLDPARMSDISGAAVAAAGGGFVVSIETEDDGRARFEVEVAQGGDDVDVELADDLAVVAVDR